jgi:hypothetical protein
VTARRRIARSALTDSPGACPSQWEGQTLDGEFFYFRYRHGRLSFGFGPTDDDAVLAAITMNQTAPMRLLDEESDGYLDTDALLTYVSPFVEVTDG